MFPKHSLFPKQPAFPKRPLIPAVSFTLFQLWCIRLWGIQFTSHTTSHCFEIENNNVDFYILFWNRREYKNLSWIGSSINLSRESKHNLRKRQGPGSLCRVLKDVSTLLPCGYALPTAPPSLFSHLHCFQPSAACCFERVFCLVDRSVPELIKVSPLLCLSLLTSPQEK